MLAEIHPQFETIAKCLLDELDEMRRDGVITYITMDLVKARILKVLRQESRELSKALALPVTGMFPVDPELAVGKK